MVSLDLTIITSPTVTSGDVAICQGDSTLLDADEYTNYLWNTGENTQTIYADTAGTYSVTIGTECNATDDLIVTVNPQDDATFAYSASSYCSDDSDPTPTISGTAGGTFSSTAGLVMTNGVIDLDASTAGTYTITYTTAGVCSATSTQDVTITTPSTDFNYGGATEFCLGTNNPVATISGVSGGTFSATGVLVIDS